MKALPNHSCPLCGGPNACAPAQAGRLDVECWCNQAKVSPEALARVPEALRNQACLCAACAYPGADKGNEQSADQPGSATHPRSATK